MVQRIERSPPKAEIEVQFLAGTPNIMTKFLLHLFLMAVLLNFAWEMTQLPLYSEVGLGTRDYVEALRIHWDVTIKDALMIITVYAAISFFFKNWKWPVNFEKEWLVFIAALPIWQAVVEYYSVYLIGRWAYGELMPTILGVGLSPLLQMLLLPSAAILLSRHLLRDHD